MSAAPRRARAALAALLVAAAVASTLTDNLVNGSTLGRDSGVYQYVAWRALQGEVPYRDVWDHKPPLIYAINAAGVLLTPRSTAGVQGIELAATAAALLLALSATERRHGTAAGVTAALLLLLGVASLARGNTAEVYALPLQLGAYAIVGRGRRLGPRAALALGAMGGAAALLKPTTLGVWAAWSAALAARAALRPAPGRWREAAAQIGWAAAGACLAAAPAAAYFAWNGALGSAFDAVVRYNAAYTAAAPGERLAALLRGLELTGAVGLAPAALAGLVLALRRARRGELGLAEALPAAALPIDLALTFAAGRPLRQYYAAWLPELTLLAGAAIGAGASWAAARGAGRARRRSPWPLRAALGLALAAAGALAALAAPQGAPPPESSASAAERLIGEATAPGDRVLIWGAEPGVNFRAGRAAPSRFVYQNPLFTPGYARPELTDELVRDLQASPPALIVDASNSDGMRLVPPLGAGAPGPAGAVSAFMAGRYRSIGAVGAQGWTVYARADR